MTDESIVNLSDTTKAAMRNYAMVAGFMILFIYAAILVSIFFTGKTPVEALGMSNFIFMKFLVGISLAIIGGMLAFLHKRDQVAITFILMTIVIIISPLVQITIGGNGSFTRLPVMLVLAIVGVAMLFTRNEQKYMCGLILLPYALISLINAFCNNHTINAIGDAILAIASLYGALCIVSENPRFPGYKMLTADEIDETQDGSPIHFKVSGSILGYALIMIPSVCTLLFYFNVGGIGVANIKGCEIACGLMLVFVGFLMLTAGRMKFTPFMFIMIGVIMSLQPIINTSWLIFVFFLIVGMMCLIRPDRRILVGISIIMLGMMAFFRASGVYPCNEAWIAAAALSVVLLSYICFALCSDNRLKLI